MARRAILEYPAPELRRIAAAVPGAGDDLTALIADLVETLNALPGCVGIAAPQVGASVRLVIVDASRYRKPVPNQGRMVLVNPALRSSAGQGIFREGCLSLPDYTANVSRATSVEYETLDAELRPRLVQARDFEAVVIQHEVDHLDGILFIDRVVSLKTDLFRRKNCS